jgi:hypothetical protein
MTIEQNLTDRTKSLLDSLKSQGYNIELEVRPELKDQLEGAWGVIPTYKIVAENDLVNKEAFTHELLHVYLFTLSFKDCDLIFKNINNGIYLFNREFILATNNNLAHFKMVAVFERLGFDKNLFFGTSLQTQLDETNKHVDEITTTDPNIKMQEFINAYSSTRLLRQLFSLDTSTIEGKLRLLDNNLFEICEEEFTKWITQADADNLVFYNSLKTRLTP